MCRPAATGESVFRLSHPARDTEKSLAVFSPGINRSPSRIMRTLHHGSKTFKDDLAAFCRSAVVPKEIADSVAAIIADVRARGDEAVSYYAAKFDGAKLRARDFRVPEAEIAAAASKISAAESKALAAAHAAIVAYNKRGLPKDWTARNPQGAMVGEKFDPIRRVGLYVPGGEVPLVSTVLMTVTLAKIAG